MRMAAVLRSFFWLGEILNSVSAFSALLITAFVRFAFVWWFVYEAFTSFTLSSICFFVVTPFPSVFSTTYTASRDGRVKAP